MSNVGEFEYITTEANVMIYEAAVPIFDGLLAEVRRLSSKKPEATMSAGKVKIINRVFEDLLIILKDQPQGKYLDLLDDASLPQMSDALFAMVQFLSAIQAFKSQFKQSIGGDRYWITHELLKEWDDEKDVDGVEVTPGGYRDVSDVPF